MGSGDGVSRGPGLAAAACEKFADRDDPRWIGVRPRLSRIPPPPVIIPKIRMERL
jgi:hypothetical protein